MLNLGSLVSPNAVWPEPSFRQVEQNYKHSVLIMRSRSFDIQVAWMEKLLAGPRAIGGEDRVAMIYMMAHDLQHKNAEMGNFMIELLMDHLRSKQS